MKWNKRLKSVLTESEKSDFSKDSLETQLRITANTPKNLVSAVIRSDEFRHFPENLTNSDTGEKESNLVSAVIRSAYSRHSLKTSDDLAQFEADTFHEVLNRFIADGITFDVSADDFQTIDPAERLKASDKEFLKLNGAAILCTLQQALLMKQLSLDDLQMFKDEINERTAILSDGAKISPPFEIIAEFSREWFADLLLKL